MRSSESQEASREYKSDETDYDKIRAIEQDEILQNPENVGFNLTLDQLIDTRRMGDIADAQQLIDEIGEEAAFAKLSEKIGRPEAEIRQVFDTAIEEEMEKVEKFKTYLDSLVHPFAPYSPFSLENSHNGCDPVAVEQMKAVYEKVNSGENPGDFTVVMNPYTDKRGGNLPETPEDIQAYSDMCLKSAEQL